MAEGKTRIEPSRQMAVAAAIPSLGHLGLGGELACFGPPHLRIYCNSANLLRSHRLPRASPTPQRSEDRHADGNSGFGVACFGLIVRRIDRHVEPCRAVVAVGWAMSEIFYQSIPRAPRLIRHNVLYLESSHAEQATNNSASGARPSSRPTSSLPGLFRSRCTASEQFILLSDHAGPSLNWSSLQPIAQRAASN